MFKQNDTILYGCDGVCTIEGKTRRKFGKKMVDYYVLKPVYQQSATFFVPVDNDKLTGRMHRILSKDEILAFIDSIPEEDDMWIDDLNDRRNKYKEIVAGGDRRELIRLIKALYTHKQKLLLSGKRPCYSDEKIFKDAERLLYNEFALVLEIPPEQVLPFILKKLSAKEQSQ